MDSLARHAASVLTGINVDKSRIDVAVAELIATMAEDFAGQHIYIPTDYTHRSQERAMSIYNACNGRNHAEVAREFGVSERTVYRIYKRILRQIKRQNQVDMFN